MHVGFGETACCARVAGRRDAPDADAPAPRPLARRPGAGRGLSLSLYARYASVPADSLTSVL